MQCVRVSGGDRVTVRPFEPPAGSFQAALVTAEVAPLAQKRAAAATAAIELDAPDLAAHLLSRFAGQVQWCFFLVLCKQGMCSIYMPSELCSRVLSFCVPRRRGGGRQGRPLSTPHPCELFSGC